MIQILLSLIVFVLGILIIIYQIFFKKEDKVYTDLKHIKVSAEWKQIVYDSWARASAVLQLNGINAKTKCAKIIIEKGEKLNPKTGQWGKMGKDGFWYAGLGAKRWIKIVADKDGKPYRMSKAILTHEVAETILNMDKKWAKASNDERNIFLWSLGL